MSLAELLPKQPIDTLFNGQQPDPLPCTLREQLKRRPPRPSRGLTSNLVSLFLTQPYVAQLLLQYVAPLLRRVTGFGSVAVFGKHRDVQNILDRDDDFPSGPTIGPGLVSGDFILGMDRGPLHREDLAMLWEALYRIVPEPGRPLPKNGPGPTSQDVDSQLRSNGWFHRLDTVVVKPIDREVKAAIDRALHRKGRHQGKIDLVQEVFRPACVEIVVQRYFGIGPVDRQWTEALWDILQIIGMGIALPYDLLLTNKTDPVIREVNWAAMALKVAVVGAVDKARLAYRHAVTIPNNADDEAIAQAEAAYHEAVAVDQCKEDQKNRLKDFLDQSDLIRRMYVTFVQKKVPEEEIPDAILRNVAGVAIAGCPPVAKAAAQVVDILLSRPLAFKGASDAARKAVDQSASAADRKTHRDLFWEFIFEALRFFPAFPLLTRACLRDTSIGTSQGCRRKLRAGQSVVVGMLPAMFDDEAVPFPHQFRTDRAPGDSLVFGRGLHACLGFQLAREVLVAMLLPLFAHGFERLPGKEGKLIFDLLAVKNLKVKVKPAGAAS